MPQLDRSSTWPLGQRSAWAVAALLTFAYAIALIDRNFLALVFEDIKADLALSDFMVALIIGPAFAIFYIVMGLPLGWLSDRTHRPFLMAAGMVLWCLATASCGLAGGFAALFVSRLAVGFGEATLSPCALSLIADYFPEHARGRAIGVYASGALFGAGAAYLLGGQVVGLMSARPHLGWAPLDALRPWQASLVFLGALGLAVAVPMLFIREPRGGGRARRERISGPSMAQAIRIMSARWRVYGGVMLCIASLFIVGYTSLWTVALFQRTWGWTAAQIGAANGILIIATAFPGATVSGWLVDRLNRKGRHDGAIFVLMGGVLVIGPAFCLYPLMPNGALAIALLAVGTFAQGIISGAGPAAIMQITRREIRGQAAAWYYLIVTLCGLFVGPPMVGLLTDMLGGAHMLRYSLSAIGLAFSLLAFVALPATRRGYQSAAVETLAAEAAARAPP